VFDDQGRGEGLGSRYFGVLNTGATSVAAPEEVIDKSAIREGVHVRRGVNRSRKADRLEPDINGEYSLEMEQGSTIELQVAAATGNVLVLGQARRLPIGSTLRGGVFYWQPGPAFLGEYTMQFKRPDGTNVPVRVKIVPKR